MMFRWYTFWVIVLVIVLFISGVATGWGIKESQLDQYYTSYGQVMSKDEVIAFLKSARRTHEYYVLNPEKASKYTGSAEDNKRITEAYTKIIEFIEGNK